MKLGLVGCGKMGSALLAGILDSGAVGVGDVSLFDTHRAAADDLANSHDGCTVTETLLDLARQTEALIIAVKPPQVAEVIQGCATGRTDGGHLFISIAAGVTLDQMRSVAGPGQRFVRVMPNTPCLVGAGASGVSSDPSATADDMEFTLKCMGSVGLAFEVPEKLLDAVTGLSGSGPAYVYTIIEALSDAGVREGLSRDQAQSLAVQTVLGGAEMVRQTQLHPAVLREQVTSPGGTTIAGLAALEEHGLRSAIQAGVRAAAERSRTMSRE